MKKKLVVQEDTLPETGRIFECPRDNPVSVDLVRLLVGKGDEGPQLLPDAHLFFDLNERPDGSLEESIHVIERVAEALGNVQSLEPVSGPTASIGDVREDTGEGWRLVTHVVGLAGDTALMASQQLLVAPDAKQVIGLELRTANKDTLGITDPLPPVEGSVGDRILGLAGLKPAHS